MTNKKMELQLTVSYSAVKFPNFDIDSKIQGIVGQPPVGKGMTFQTQIRDVHFLFNDEKKAKKALTRVKAQGMKAELSVH